MADSFLKLVNPSYSLEWNDKSYQVKKATLEQIAQYQQRAEQYVNEKQAGSDMRLAAYAIYLVLSKVIPNLTEQEVLENTAGDLDLVTLFTTLGFMNPARFQAALTVASPSTTVSSGQLSPIEADGALISSAS